MATYKKGNRNNKKKTVLEKNKISFKEKILGICILVILILIIIIAIIYKIDDTLHQVK